MAGTDFSHLTNDELIKGIKALDLPDYIRSKAYGVDVRETLAQMTEMTIQLGVNMGLSPDDALDWARKLQETVSQSEFDSWVATLLDGGPSIFMNTLSELQTTYPNGAAGVALVRETDPAKIYVWNGSAWEDFGAYQGIVVADGSITSNKIADGAITLPKINQNDLKLWSPFETFEDDKRNLISGLIYGTMTPYLAFATIEYVADVNIFYPTLYALRFNYTAGAGSYIRTPSIDTTNFVNLPKHGLWLRDSDITNLGNSSFRLGFKSSVGVHYGLWVTVENYNKLGYTNTNTMNGVTIQTSVLAKFNGWTFVQAKITNSTVTLGTINADLNVNTTVTSSSKIDISKWLLVDTASNLRPLDTYASGNNFTNIKGNIIGDSIAYPSEGYAMVIEQYLGMRNRLNRHAIGGRPIANGTANGDGANTYAKIWTNGVAMDYTIYTMSLIAGGTNDFKLDVPIGTISYNFAGGYDTTTFAGALQDLIEHILNANKTINIVLFTPLQRDKDGYNVLTVNGAGHKLVDYVDTIIEIGALYSLPVYDAYRNSGVNPFTLSTYTYDGLHLNGQSTNTGPGYKMVGTKFAKFIKQNVTAI